MIDDSFGFSPVEIRRFEFPKALRGYDPVHVENFRNRVAEEMERLTRQNNDLEAKAKGFHEQLRAFRERDKALNDALVSAQQLRSEIREQAEREAQLILREARAEAERVVESARMDARRLEQEVAALDKARRTFIVQLRSMIERQLIELDAAASVTPPVVERDGGDARVDQQRASIKTPAWLDSLVKE